METIGERICRLRTVRGLTRYALAHLVQCEPISIMQYEYGSTTPSLKTVNRLAEFFGVSAEYLLNGGECE